MPGRHENRRPRVNDALARTARTGLQGTPAWLAVALLDTFVDLSDKQFGLLVLILTGLIGWAQATVENAVGAGILRQVPPTTAPVVDEAGESAVGLAVAALVVVVLVLVVLRLA